MNQQQGKTDDLLKSQQPIGYVHTLKEFFEKLLCDDKVNTEETHSAMDFVDDWIWDYEDMNSTTSTKMPLALFEATIASLFRANCRLQSTVAQTSLKTPVDDGLGSSVADQQHYKDTIASLHWEKANLKVQLLNLQMSIHEWQGLEIDSEQRATDKEVLDKLRKMELEIGGLRKDNEAMVMELNDAELMRKELIQLRREIKWLQGAHGDFKSRGPEKPTIRSAISTILKSENQWVYERLTEARAQIKLLEQEVQRLRMTQ